MANISCHHNYMPGLDCSRWCKRLRDVARQWCGWSQWRFDTSAYCVPWSESAGCASNQPCEIGVLCHSDMFTDATHTYTPSYDERGWVWVRLNAPKTHTPTLLCKHYIVYLSSFTPSLLLPLLPLILSYSHRSLWADFPPIFIPAFLLFPFFLFLTLPLNCSLF